MATSEEQPKTKKRIRKTTSMREKAVKAQKKQESPSRLRSGAQAVKKPIVKAREGARREYHLITPREKGFLGFLTKNRYWTPRYFRSAFEELKNVSWPNRRNTWKMMFAVVMFSTVVGLAIALVDYGLEKLLKEVLL